MNSPAGAPAARAWACCERRLLCLALPQAFPRRERARPWERSAPRAAPARAARRDPHVPPARAKAPAASQAPHGGCWTRPSVRDRRAWGRRAWAQPLWSQSAWGRPIRNRWPWGRWAWSRPEASSQVRCVPDQPTLDLSAACRQRSAYSPVRHRLAGWGSQDRRARSRAAAPQTPFRRTTKEPARPEHTSQPENAGFAW